MTRWQMSEHLRGSVKLVQPPYDLLGEGTGTDDGGLPHLPDSRQLWEPRHEAPGARQKHPSGSFDCHLFDEGEEVLVDLVGVCCRHAVREPRIEPRLRVF